MSKAWQAHVAAPAPGITYYTLLQPQITHHGNQIAGYSKYVFRSRLFRAPLYKPLTITVAYTFSVLKFQAFRNNFNPNQLCIKSFCKRYV